MSITNNLSHNNVIEFDLSESDEAFAFAQLIKSLNQNGIPYALENEGIEAKIFIGDGF